MTGRRAVLGLTSATALVVANMIGVGVFTTSGFALQDLGRRDAVLWAWVAGGALAMAGATCYAALARQMPESGGEYHYLSQAFHPFAGFMAGWVSLLAGFTAPIAAAAFALQSYLLPASKGGPWLGTLAIAAAGVAHGVRVRGGALLQNAVVAVKLTLILAFALLGGLALPASSGQFAPAPPLRLPVFAGTLVWVSFSYSGWNAAVYVAGELQRPRIITGRAMLLGTGLVTVLYVALNAVFVHAAPMSVLAGQADIAAVAAAALGGPTLRALVVAIVALALWSSISSMVMAGPRVYAKMAGDGLLPRWLDAGGKAPATAVGLQVTAAIAVLWLTELRQLLSYIGFTLSLSTAAAVTALMLLRRRQGAGAVPVPGYPWLPLAFVGTTLAIGAGAAAHQPELLGAGLATVLLGAPLYFWPRRRR